MFKDYPAIDEMMDFTQWDYNNKISKDDNRCDFLMRKGGDLDRLLLALDEIKKPENHNIFHIVKYDDLVLSPKETINSIYDFIGIEYYQHDFDNIRLLETYYDERVGAPSYTHNVKKTLEKTAIKPEDVLSEYVLSKYSRIDHFGL